MWWRELTEEARKRAGEAGGQHVTHVTLRPHIATHLLAPFPALPPLWAPPSPPSGPKKALLLHCLGVLCCLLGCVCERMGLTIFDCPRAFENNTASAPGPGPLVGGGRSTCRRPVTAAQIDSVALAIEHLLVQGTLAYIAIVDVLASEGGVAPWLATAGKAEHFFPFVCHASGCRFRGDGRPPTTLSPGRPPNQSRVLLGQVPRSMLGGSAGTGRACAAAARGGAGEERWESDLENRGKSAATPPTFCGALPPFSLKAAVEAWLAGVSLALFPSLS